VKALQPTANSNEDANIERRRTMVEFFQQFAYFLLPSKKLMVAKSI